MLTEEIPGLLHTFLPAVGYGAGQQHPSRCRCDTHCFDCRPFLGPNAGLLTTGVALAQVEGPL